MYIHFFGGYHVIALKITSKLLFFLINNYRKYAILYVKRFFLTTKMFENFSELNDIFSNS